MPEKLHRMLRQQALKKGLKGKRKSVYIYGTMNKLKIKKNKLHHRVLELKHLLLLIFQM